MRLLRPRCLPVLLALALGPGGLPALALQPEGVLLAQAAAGQKPVPAEVQGWFDGAAAAYRRGDPAEALRLRQQVVVWLRANRGPVDAELADALGNLGVFLGAVGRRGEALAPTEEAVKIFRDLGGPEKTRSTAAQLVSASQARQTGAIRGNQGLLQLLNAADVPETP
ncbi:MAG: tetratricopeptide repeat protein [Cyanobacteriota bacterium]|nr:tetratricopeptide repeat protein [Cyanobacteriota bacterium]